MCLVSMNEYNVLLVKGIVGALVEVFLMNAHKYTCAALIAAMEKSVMREQTLARDHYVQRIPIWCNTHYSQ